MNRIVLYPLSEADFTPVLLDDFNRYQEVHNMWTIRDTNWTLINHPFKMNWDETYKQMLISEEFPQYLASGGAMIGAFDNGKLIGLAGLDGNLIGSERQYAWLVKLHVSREHRGRGIGAELLSRISAAATALGAAKLYISANPAEESIRFYRNHGCEPSEERIADIAAIDPYELQLELKLK